MSIQYLKNFTFIDRPLWWHNQGLSQTASGYGRKLTSSRCVKTADGKVRRVYVTCYSNSGTAWVTIKGEQWIVNECYADQQ